MSTNIEQIPACKPTRAVPWSILLGLAPFLYLAAEAYFTARANKEAIIQLSATQRTISGQLARIETQTRINQAILERLSKDK